MERADRLGRASMQNLGRVLCLPCSSKKNGAAIEAWRSAFHCLKHPLVIRGIVDVSTVLCIAPSRTPGPSCVLASICTSHCNRLNALRIWQPWHRSRTAASKQPALHWSRFLSAVLCIGQGA